VHARLATVLLLLSSCAKEPSDVDFFAGVGKGDFYGSDDRQQILDSPHPRALEWARATAVIVNRSMLGATTGGDLYASPQTLGERQGLRANAGFARGPVLGFCSAFLVAPDLVATAGHCFKQTLCDEMIFIFDFYIGGASENVDAIPAANAYGCREVVSQQYGDGLDYALVRLDRPALGRTPFVLQAEPPSVGSRVALVGYPSGIPAKIDTAGEVLRIEGTRTRTSVDSFPGHSGGVMIDLATGNAFGVHVEGSSPSFVSNGSCNVTASCAQVNVSTDGPCNGAVETNATAFAGCCDGGAGAPPPPPPDPPTPTDDACLPSGAPCERSGDCTNSMCACDTVNATTESFVVPGSCNRDGCEDPQVLCALECIELAPIDSSGNQFAYAWSMATCSED